MYHVPSALSFDPAVGPSLSFVPEQDEPMSEVEPTGTAAPLADPPSAEKADRAARLAAEKLLSLQQTPTDVAVRALVEKIEASTTVFAIASHVPLDYRSTVLDFIKKYHADVMRLGTVATQLAKLRQHQANGTYPTAIHSIREPKIQWTSEFLAAPQSSRHNFGGGTCGFTTFAEAVTHETVTMKDNVLKGWITEKTKELALFQSAANAATGVDNLRTAIDERTSDLRSRYTFDAAGGRPFTEPIPSTIREILAGREFQQEVLYRVTPTIIGKICSVVQNAEDHRLSDALKRMELSIAAPRASSETRKNDVDALAKKIADLTKKLGGKKKVSHALSPFILCSASTSSVNFRQLADLCSDLLEDRKSVV